MEPTKMTEDPIQLAQVLKSFAELRDNKSITDEDYDRLKASVIEAVEQQLNRLVRVSPDVQKEPPPHLIQQSQPNGIDEFAGDLHRYIVEKLAHEYPIGENPSEEKLEAYLIEAAAKLIASKALNSSDMSPMTKVIETVVRKNHAESLVTLVQALNQLNAIRNEVRRSADSSSLAKAITGIASDSAENTVKLEAGAPKDSPTETNDGPKRRARWWGSVLVDVDGAFMGASAAAGILAIPGVSIPYVSIGSQN